MVLGAGSELWRVEVVLWVAQGAAGSEPLLIEAVRKELRELATDDVVHIPVITNARSYDIQPIEPDGSVGVQVGLPPIRLAMLLGTRGKSCGQLGVGSLQERHGCGT
jgi:hypothetical protein